MTASSAPTCGELTQTKQSDMRLDKMEAALACPQRPSADPQTLQRKWTSNESPRLQGPPPLALEFQAGRNLTQIVDFRNGRGERIRTSDPLLPKQVRYQAALRPDCGDEMSV
jgi:hypothetical protein